MNEPMFRLDEDRGVSRRRFASPSSATLAMAGDAGAQPPAPAPRPAPLPRAASAN